jgi:hypothetical protein
VNHSKIHLSQITVETAQVVKPCRETLADDEDEYYAPETQGIPTLGELSVLKENAVSVTAYPKVVQHITTVSYLRPQEDRPESSDDKRDGVGSRGSGPDKAGSFSDDESSKETESDSDSESECDNVSNEKHKSKKTSRRQLRRYR